MKVMLLNRSRNRNLLLPYFHGQVVEVENPFTLAAELFAKGFNVMVYHRPEGGSGPDVSVAVDTLLFQAR